LQAVIVGNGIAGDTVASTMRSIDKEVGITIVSKDRHPLYSACVLPKKYLSNEMEREEVFLRKKSYYKDNDINLIGGKEVQKVNTESKSVILNSKSIGYDKLVIASGSRPGIPPFGRVEKNGIFCLKTIEDADAIKGHKGRKAVVIGSGPIGIESAVALHKIGYEVTVIEMLDRILPKLFDTKEAAILCSTLKDNGIRVLTGELVSEILGKKTVEGVVTARRKLECDTVLLTCGMRPNTEFLIDSGIETGKYRGIKVNAKMETNIDDVYACGDCVETKDVVTGEDRLSLLWHTAMLQGYVAGCNSLEVSKIYPGSLNFTVVEVFEKYAVSSGNTFEELMGRKSKIFEDDSGGTYKKLIVSDDSIIGLQFIGEDLSFDIGFILGAIRRGESITRLEEITENASLLSHTPWVNWARSFTFKP